MVYANERANLLRQLSWQQKSLSRARRLFIEDILKVNNYNEFREEILAHTNCLEKEISENQDMINNLCLQRNLYSKSAARPFKNYSMFDVDDKKQLANIIPPFAVDFTTGHLSTELPEALKKILVYS
jgi:muconolactone delta-isomerase